MKGYCLNRLIKGIIITVKESDFVSFFKKYSLDLFSFSYIYVPDQLQAEQVVVDSILAVSLKEKELIDKLVKIPSTGFNDAKRLNGKLQILLYSKVASLGKTRSQQLNGSVSDQSGMKSKYSDFYSLGLDRREVIFLKDSAGKSIEDISKILGKSEYEVMAILAGTRDTLVNASSHLQGF